MVKPLAKAVLVALALSTAVYAAGPAVSEKNGKVTAFAGNVNGSHLEAISAAFSMPLTDSIGLQVDALHGKKGVDNGGEDELKGLGVHVFMRDPESHLFGLTASYAEAGDTNVQRYGIEGENYLGDITVGVRFGHQLGDIDDSGYGQLSVVYYPTDDLAIGIGASKADADDRWGLAAEYQTPVSGLALFANTQSGNKSFDSLTAGIRYYFGAEKSLKARHREDDPGNGLFDDLNTNTTNIEESRKKPPVDPCARYNSKNISARSIQNVCDV